MASRKKLLSKVTGGTIGYIDYNGRKVYFQKYQERYPTRTWKGSTSNKVPNIISNQSSPVKEGGRSTIEIMEGG